MRHANSSRALVSPGIEVPDGSGQQCHTITRLFRVEGLGFRHAQTQEVVLSLSLLVPPLFDSLSLALSLSLSCSARV